MAQRCMSCERVSSRPLHKTVIGRLICDRCNDTLMGLAAGEIAGGGVAGAMGTASWYAEMRASLRDVAARRRGRSQRD